MANIRYYIVNSRPRRIICLVILWLAELHKTNVKNFQFKTVCNGDTANITQLKQQEWKMCYYFGSTSP